MLTLMLLPAMTLAVAPRSAFAQSQQFHMDQYNSDITINQDGSLDIVETLVYVYDSGSFHRGTRYWLTNRFDSITNIQVAEIIPGPTNSVPLINYRQSSYDPDDSKSGEPGTFGMTTEGNRFKVRWVYDYVSNTSKAFRLSYHVTGGVKVYSDRDELDWYAIPQDWSSPINRSRVQVTLPQGMDASKALNITSKPSAEVSKQGNGIAWAIGNNSGLEVGAHLPKGIVQATKPVWQDRVDNQGLIDLVLLLAGLLLLIGGVLWSIRTWYTKGRDKPVKLLSDYITAPPSNLSPGLVGTLLDESADVRDVIATVVDQGRKGNLVMQETEQSGLFSSKDFEYKQLNNKAEYRFEEMVLNSIFSRGNPVRLSELKNTFYSSLPPIYDEMYRSLVTLKYFPENPKAVRTRNYALGVVFFVLAGLAALAAVVLAESVSVFLFAFPVAFAAIGLVRLITAGVMPRKTDFGSEEAEKWRAFGRYLQQMKQYTDVQAAADKFQQYLPYAVAMGMERQLISQFNSVPSAMPPYYVPYGYGPFIPYPIGMGAEGSQSSQGPASGGPMPQFNPADAMQGMSDSLAGAMQGMSDSFTSMVNSASSIMTSQPSSSGSDGSGGGGWGGGGGSFGGGGGGGGGGGAD